MRQTIPMGMIGSQRTAGHVSVRILRKNLEALPLRVLSKSLELLQLAPFLKKLLRKKWTQKAVLSSNFLISKTGDRVFYTWDQKDSKYIKVNEYADGTKENAEMDGYLEDSGLA